MLVHGRTKDRRRPSDRLQYYGARLLTALPPRVQVRLSGGAPIVVDGQTLDPELQILLHARARMGAPPGLAPETPEVSRRPARRAPAGRGARGRAAPAGAPRRAGGPRPPPPPPPPPRPPPPPPLHPRGAGRA